MRDTLFWYDRRKKSKSLNETKQEIWGKKRPSTNVNVGKELIVGHATRSFCLGSCLMTWPSALSLMQISGVESAETVTWHMTSHGTITEA
jgi:hypothetical protein